MELYAKILLSGGTAYIKSLLTARGNEWSINNIKKVITIHKKAASSGTVYHMYFLPVVMDGYEAIRPNKVSTEEYNGITYWYSPASNNGTNQYIKFNIVSSATGKVVAEYQLNLIWED